jgi:hypothetical protein
MAVTAVGFAVGWVRKPKEWRRLLAAILCALSAIALSLDPDSLSLDATEWFWLLCCIPFVMIVLILAYPVMREEKRRRSAIVAWAGQNGFSILSAERRDAAKTLPAALLKLPFFARGESSATDYVLKKTKVGYEVLLFDYEYTKLGLRDPNWFFQRARIPVRHTIVAFELPGARLPAFELRPERFWDHVTAVPGREDIAFESHPGFSAAYHLSGADPQAIRQILRDNVLSWFDANPNLFVEGCGERLLTYRPRDVPFLSLDATKRIPPQELSEYVATATEVFELLRGCLDPRLSDGKTSQA